MTWVAFAPRRKRQADDHTVDAQIGQRLSATRMDRGLTQLALAELSGVDNTAISNMERGLRRVYVVDLIALADALEVQIGDLLPKATEPPPPPRLTDRPGYGEWTT